MSRNYDKLYNKIKSGELRVTVTTSPPIHRFLKKVNKDGPIHPVCGQCWEWLGSLSRSGYGQFMVAHKALRAHRYSYEIHIGGIPAGLDILHKCDNKKCVNPNHLTAGTKQDNIADKVAKDRQAKGMKMHFAKLTDDQVREIRRRYKRTGYHGSNMMQLVREFKVARSTMTDIVRGKRWKHLLPKESTG